MNLGEIRAEIKRYGFGDLDYNDAAIDGVINAAYRDIQSEGAFPFTEVGPTTVALSTSGPISTTTLPSDYNKVRAITVGGNKLRYLNQDDFIQMQITNTGTGTPEYYTIWNSELLVWPLPAGATNATVWYHQTLTALTSDSHIPDMPDRWHYLLVYGALERLYSATDEDDKRSIYSEQWARMIEQMKDDLGTTEFDRTEVIGSDYSLGSIAKLVREHGFEDIGNSQISLFANQTIRELCSRYNWSFLEKGPVELTIDSDVVALPADCAKPRRITIDNCQLEHQKMESVWRGISEKSTETTGQPEIYSIWGFDTDGETKKINVFPTPTQSYAAKLWYVTKAPAITDVTDVPPFPAAHHGVILYGVLLKCAIASADEINISKINIFRDEYNNRLEEMFQDLMQDTYDSPQVIVEDPNFY